MSTSGTYNFASPQSELIIRDAYERVGIYVNTLPVEKILSAQRSLNFILQSWINRGLNLWTVKQGMLALYNNQSAYNLPLYTSDILEATLRTSVRNLGGTAFSSAGGTAANAFSDNAAAACTQNASNGYISYHWTSLYAIAMVGVTSNATLDYQLVFEYSNDNATWTTVGAPLSQTYAQGAIQWFVIQTPTLGSYFRVRETNGEILDINKLYFNTLLQDTIITRLSRAEYIATPNKSQTGRPTSFYVDRQINPVLYIWQTPNTQYNNLFYTYIEQIQDIGSLINTAQIPARFLEALCAALAYRLSIKEHIDINLINMLGMLAEAEFKVASEEDAERVPLRIFGDYTQGWSMT